MEAQPAEARTGWAVGGTGWAATLAGVPAATTGGVPGGTFCGAACCGTLAAGGLACAVTVALGRCSQA